MKQIIRISGIELSCHVERRLDKSWLETSFVLGSPVRQKKFIFRTEMFDGLDSASNRLGIQLRNSLQLFSNSPYIVNVRVGV